MIKFISKKIFCLFFFSFITNAGSAQKLIINGEVANKDTGDVLVSYESRGKIFNKISKLSDGKFFTRVKLDGIKLISISLNDKKATFWAAPGRIIFRTSINDFDNFYVKGSQVHDDVIRRNKFVDSIISNENRSLNKEDERISIYKADTLFISKNSNSFYSLYLLDFYFEDLDYFFIKRVLYDAFKKYKNSALFQQLKSRVSLIENARTGSYINNFYYSDNEGKQGQFVDLLSGHNFYLLDFWASWCLPCRKNSTYLNVLFDLFKEKSFNIISITLDTSQKRWQNAIVQDKLDRWPHIKLFKNEDLGKLFAVKSIPTLILIDSTGKIIRRFSGKYFGKDNLKTTLNDLIE